MAGSIWDILNDPAQRSRLPAGMRNNNPGNIKYVGQKDAVGPSVNTDQGDPQAVYASPEQGMAAMYRLLGKKYAGGKTTPDAIIAGEMGWTPGNHEAAANVARYMGIKPDEDIGFNDPARAQSFMRALMRQEHGEKSSLYTDDMIAAALKGSPVIASATPAISMGAPQGAVVPGPDGVMPPLAAAPGIPAAPVASPTPAIAMGDRIGNAVFGEDLAASLKKTFGPDAAANSPGKAGLGLLGQALGGNKNQEAANREAATITPSAALVDDSAGRMAAGQQLMATLMASRRKPRPNAMTMRMGA